VQRFVDRHVADIGRPGIAAGQRRATPELV